MMRKEIKNFLNPKAEVFYPKSTEVERTLLQSAPTQQTTMVAGNIDLGQTMMMLAKNQIKASLPKCEPSKFDGTDPTE